ncbi:mannosyl-oligosaccharide alpha-mannosidase, partial [Thalassiosira pseudonana CCMP1335]
MPTSQIEANKALLQSMFTHAFDSYMFNAFPASELHPVTCHAGTFHLVRIPALTLIDSLDTLLILGNHTEFARSGEHKRGERGGLFGVNQNVSLFETTIRVLGGLLSAHQMANSTLTDDALNYWKYDGVLLTLAHDLGKRLLHAFDTETGIPYGTVNLLRGVPKGETTVASLAGAGTLTLEFELLSRLTGDDSFGKAAKMATRELWMRRSSELNLMGKHIDSKSGKWTESLSGIGSNSDSFYEYLVKHYVLFPDDEDFWTMFVAVYSGIWSNSRLGDWYVDVDMNHGLNGNVRQIFESLMAFYPGLQILLGEVSPAAKTLNSFFLVREFLGLLPERFNFVHWKTEGSGDVHPLRPELLESCISSHHTTSWLWAADFALHAVNKLSWTPCGYATVKKVLNIKHHNEMPSYFLSETIKYLYLTFDAEDNILTQDTERDWVFTTEAHPIHYVPS